MKKQAQRRSTALLEEGAAEASGTLSGLEEWASSGVCMLVGGSGRHTQAWGTLREWGGLAKCATLTTTFYFHVEQFGLHRLYKEESPNGL